MRNQLPDDDSDPTILPIATIPDSLASLAQPCSMVPFGMMARSFDTTTFAGKQRLVACCGPGTLDLDKNGRLYLNVVAWAVYIKQSVSRETGEVIAHPWCVLVDDSGETFATASEWFGPKIRGIFDLFGPKDIEAGIPVTIVKRESRQPGQTYHDMQLGHTNPRG